MRIRIRASGTVASALAVSLLLVVWRLVLLAAPMSSQNLNLVTAQDLAETLVGTGITFSNVQISPPPDIKVSAGKFANGKAIGGANGLGFDSGVIFSTGNISFATNLNNGANNNGNVGLNLNGDGDDQLTALLPPGSETFDATVFELDFVPDKDTVYMQYVFASEEYNEFVFDPRGFNDVFAFFVNGVNCATVGGQPVSINSINNGNPVGTTPNSNPQYFVNNDFRTGQTPGPPLQTQMDGLTKVLTCKASVTANATNHLRIAIADAGDHSVDSVVFLNLDSFTTTPPITITKRTNTTEFNFSDIGPYVLAGGPVRWTYTVTNGGTDPLSSVTVTDTDGQGLPVAVDCAGTTTLTPGQTIVCSATGTAVAGQYTNLSVATAISPLVGEVTDSSPGHYFGADPKIRIVTKTEGTDNPTLFAGEPVEWTYDVTNMGNVPLQNVQVTDSKGVAVNCGIPPPTVWAVGQTRRCTATATVQAGTYANTGQAAGSVDTVDTNGTVVTVTRTDSSATGHFGADPKLAVVKKIDGANNNAAPGFLILKGDPYLARYEVTNTGNVALANVKVTDTRLGDICTLGTVEIGASAFCERTAHAERDQQTDTGRAAGSYTGTFKTKTVTEEDPESYFGADPAIGMVTRTNTINSDAPTGPYILVGDPVRWTYAVVNAGNVAFESVVVNDNTIAGDVCTLGPLDAGNGEACSRLSTAVTGQQTNTGSATGALQTVTQDGSLKTVTRTATDPDFYFGADPQIAIVTKTNGSNNDSAPGPWILVGDPVRWTYAVTNTGNVALSIVSVIDGGAACPIAGDLAPGATDTSCAKNAAAERDQRSNLGRASGTIVTITVNGEPKVVTPTAEDPDHYFGADPQVTIVSKTQSTDNGAAPGPYVLVGGAVKWTYTVANTGNVPLEAVSVTDDQLGPICTIGNLALNATDDASCLRLSTAVKGQYTNTGRAAGSVQTVDVNGAFKTSPASDEDPDFYFGADPHIALVARTNSTDNNSPAGPFILVGDDVKWTFVVTNTGNVTLSNVEVTDDPTGRSCTVPPVAPGDEAAASCDLFGTAQQGQYSNTGTVAGSIQTVDVDGATQTVTRTASDIDHYFGAAPQLTVVTKTNGTDNNLVTGPLILVGDPVKSAYSVTNTGNVPVANVVVTDGTATVCTIGPLAIGASGACDRLSTAERDQRNNAGAGNGTIVTVNVDGSSKTVPVVGEDPDHYFGADPQIAIVKLTNGTNNDFAPGALILVGDPVKWTYRVTNVGNVPLTGVVVTDDREGPICTIGTLAVGETATCERLKSGDGFSGHGHGDYDRKPGSHYAWNDDDRWKDGSGRDGDDRSSGKDDRDERDGRKDDRGGKDDTDHDRARDDGDHGDFRDGDREKDDHGKDDHGKNERGRDDDRGSHDYDHDRDCDHDHDRGDYKPVKGAQKGQYRNTGFTSGSVRTTTIDGQLKVVTRSASNVDHYFGVDPRIKLVKKTNGKDNDAPGRAILVGRPVTWTYEVTNAGNVALAVAVTDDKVDVVTCPSPVLAAGATMVCTAAGVATRGKYENIGTARGTVDTLTADGIVKTVARTARDADYYFGADDKVCFVIGDRESHHKGDQVRFWDGDQWSRNNGTSGRSNSGNGAGGFKGYATHVMLKGDGPEGTWQASSGVELPDDLPEYVTVIVTSDMQRNGTIFGGTIKDIIVVRHDGRSRPSAGRDGRGEVVTKSWSEK